MRKKILFDISFIHKRYHTGVANYAYGFLEYIIRHNFQDQVILLVNIAEKEHFSSTYPQFEQYTIGKMWMYKLKFFMWFAFAYDFKRIVNKIDADVVYCPWENPINALKISHKKIVTIHDMQIRLDKDNFNKRTVWMQKWTDDKTISNADNIITISEFSKQQILSFYPLIKYKILNFSNSVSLVQSKNIQPMNINNQYILYVGRLDVMKNVITLIKAFNLIKNKYSSYKLVLVSSYWDYYEKEIKPFVLSHGLLEKIICIRNCSDEDLTRWYLGADLFVFPSLREGFGSPPIEAAYLKTQVISSKSDSLEEITMGLVNYYEPAEDADSLSKEMDKCLSHPKSDIELDKIKNIIYSNYSIETFGNRLFSFLNS